MEAVHKSLRDAFKILPATGMFVWSYEAHRFACPPDREKPEYYTHISIDAFAGRSLDKAIVNNPEPFGIPKNHVKILLREISKENWGIRGGQAGCDVELGFKVEV